MFRNMLMDKETMFLIKITKTLYKKTLPPKISMDDININGFIEIALKNNLLQYAAEKILERYSLARFLKVL